MWWRNRKLRELAARLRASADALRAAMGQYPVPERQTHMAILDDLAAQVTATTQVEASAVTLINGIAARIAAAVQAAVAGGATAEQLAPVAAELANLQQSAAALAAAVTANTPAAPVAGS